MENKLLKPIEFFFQALFTTPEFYLQLILALGVIIAAKIISFYIKKNVSPRSFKNENLDNFLKGALRFLTPVLVVIFLIVATVLAQEFFDDSRIIGRIAKLSRAWLILNMIWIFSGNKAIAKLITILLLPIMVLHIIGLLAPTISYLESIDFSVGKLHLSLYLIMKGAIAFIILLWLTGIVLKTGEQYIRKMTSISFNIKELLIKFFEIGTYGVVFLVTLNIMGVDLTALAVFGGALGVGIGFGLQKISSNFISGIVLLAEKSIKANDLIEIDGGLTGSVKHLGARAILVESSDGREILIPNEDFITSKVTNWTYSHTRGRAEIKVSVTYDSDILKAQALMVEAAMECEYCLKAPAPECYIAEFTDSGVRLHLYFWIENITKGRLKPKSQVFTAIWRKFADNNIKIPINQTQNT